MCSVPPSGISIVREARTVFMVVIYNNRCGGPGREGKIWEGRGGENFSKEVKGSFK